VAPETRTVSDEEAAAAHAERKRRKRTEGFFIVRLGRL